jgi:hypothetical protein
MRKGAFDIITLEGAYEQSEMIIQELLRGRGERRVSGEPVCVNGRGLEAAADWSSLKSPENYIGFERTEKALRWLFALLSAIRWVHCRKSGHPMRSGPRSDEVCS